MNPGKAIDTEKIIDTGDESVRTLNPAKIIDTDKILDTREDGEDAVLTLNPGSEKIIDTGQDADLTVNPGKVIANRHCKIIDTILTLEKTQTLL